MNNDDNQFYKILGEHWKGDIARSMEKQSQLSQPEITQNTGITVEQEGVKFMWNLQLGVNAKLIKVKFPP